MESRSSPTPTPALAKLKFHKLESTIQRKPLMPLAIWKPYPRLQLPMPSPSSSASKIQQACSAWAT